MGERNIFCSVVTLVDVNIFGSLSFLLPSFCSGLLSKLIFLLFGCTWSTFFVTYITSFSGFVFGLELCLSNKFLSDIFLGIDLCSSYDLLYIFLSYREEVYSQTYVDSNQAEAYTSFPTLV